MAVQLAQLETATAVLDIPKPIAYGKVGPIAGNLVLQHELADKTRVAFYLLGEGPWDSLAYLLVNRASVPVGDTARVHFHPGNDGEVGAGMGASSTGGDQKVDQFFSLLPGALDVVTFSRYSYLGLKVAPDPGAPGPELEVLGHYQALKVRKFDASGNQTAFAWTQNPAWWICDFLLRKFVLREGKINQPLTALEKARFDWASFVDAEAYYAADIGGGIKRFEDGGVGFVSDGLTAAAAIEQLLLMARSYLQEPNGKFALYADKARASVFTFRGGNVAPLSFRAHKANLRSGKNSLAASFRDAGLAAGSTDEATRFAIATQKVDHESHQRAIGARGPGLAVMPRVEKLQLDLGVNTGERAWRILQHHAVRQLGEDTELQGDYAAPFAAEWLGFEDSLAVVPGDVVTIDQSVGGEEFGGKDMEVLQVEERPDGGRAFAALEYMPLAFPDTAPAQQSTQAPNPGSALTPITVQTISPVPNGINLNFEDPSDAPATSAGGWIEELGAGGSTAYETASPLAGARSGKCTGQVGAATGLRNRLFFQARAGDKFYLAAFGRASVAGVQGSVRFAWYDGAGAEIGTGSITWTETASTEKSQIFTAPAGTVKGRAEMFYLAASTANGNFVADDVRMRKSIPEILPVDSRTPGLAALLAKLNDAGLLLDADQVAADGASFVRVDPNQRTGGGRAFSALDASAILVAGSADFARAYVNKHLGNVPDDGVSDRKAVNLNRYDGAFRAFSALDASNIVVAASADFARAYTNKHLGNVPDDGVSDRRAATANQKTGGDRSFAALDGSNILVAGSADFARAYTGKHLGNVPDDAVSDRKAVNADRHTGAQRAFSSLDAGNVLVAAGADFSRAYTNKSLDNVPGDLPAGRKIGGSGGVLGERVSDAIFDTGAQGRVKSSRFSASASGPVSTTELTSMINGGPTTGWRTGATIDFDVGADVSSLVFQMTAGNNNDANPSNNVVLETVGDNVGVSIHTGAAPATPTASRVGSGALTYNSPTTGQVRLTLYVKVKTGVSGDFVNAAIAEKVVPHFAELGVIT